MSDENNDLKEFQDKVSTDAKVSRRRPPSSPEIAEGKKEGPEELIGQHTQYAANGNGYLPVTDTIKILPSGCYVIRIVNNAMTFVPQRIVTDRLLRLPDSKGDMVIGEVDKFWSKKPKFEEFGFNHKRGFLLWGPPGSGKTATISLIIADMVAQGGLVIVGDANPGWVGTMLSKMREVEPNRRAVVVLEDLDAVVDRFGESELLSLLDGEGQIDNVCFIATTNYPERLDPRIVNRPSRFDRVVKIGMPNTAARKLYISDRLGKDFADLEKWAQETDGLSIAHIKEVIVSVFCLEHEFTDALKRVKLMKNTVDNDEYSKKIGLIPASRNGDESKIGG